LILYDDRQVAAAFGDDRDGILDRSLAFTAILDQWGRDPRRAARPAAEALAEFHDLVGHDALTTFFDSHGIYVGHVVIAHVVVEECAPIIHNPEVVKNRALWARGSPNWLVHVEAVNGATRMIVRRMRNGLPRSVDKLSYVRRVRGDTVVKTWRALDKAQRPLSSDTIPLADHERVPFARVRHEKSEKAHIFTHLAQDCSRPLSLRAALQIGSWAYNLKQYAILQDQSVLLVWAWCSPEGLDRMQRERAEHPADVDWNSGDIPLLIAVAGKTADVETSIRDWAATLPCGSDAPRRLVIDRLFDRYGFDLI
jgi:hemolysin-activating ACP:hemolysin acyltransferase